MVSQIAFLVDRSGVDTGVQGAGRRDCPIQLRHGVLYGKHTSKDYGTIARVDS